MKSTPKRDVRTQEVIIYDFYLPTNPEYDKILKTTLHKFFSSTDVIKDIDDLLGEIIPPNKQSTVAKIMMDIVAGYSISKVNGAFRMRDGENATEKSNVVRIIIRQKWKKKISSEYKKLILFVTQQMITRSLAKQASKEEEVWSVEYSGATLYRFVKK